MNSSKQGQYVASRQHIISEIHRLGSRQKWNHCIELADGVFTRDPNQKSEGKNLLKWDRMSEIIAPFISEGKRVLDIGCNDGFFSLKCVEAGASVVALDASPLRIEKAQFVFETKSVTHKVQLVNKSIYEFDTNEGERFDLVLCLGFIHRVPDPLTALSRITTLTNTVLLEFKAFTEYAYDRPYMVFDGRRSDPKDQFSTCHFIPSARAVVEMLKALKFDYYGIQGPVTSRRVLMIASRNKLPSMEALGNLGAPRRLFLLSKAGARFLKDTVRILRGDFFEK